MVAHYDITMGNGIAKDARCEVTLGNHAKGIHCDVTMSNDISMCTYHGIIIHNDVVIN